MPDTKTILIQYIRSNRALELFRILFLFRFYGIYLKIIVSSWVIISYFYYELSAEQ